MAPSVLGNEALCADESGQDVILALPDWVAVFVMHHETSAATPSMVVRLEPESRPGIDRDSIPPPHPDDRGSDRGDPAPMHLLIRQVWIPPVALGFDSVGLSRSPLVLVQARNTDAGVYECRPFRSQGQQHTSSDLRNLGRVAAACRPWASVRLDVHLPRRGYFAA